MVVTLGSSKATAFGNSLPLAYAKAYLPWLELISTVLLSSTTNVRGCSGKVFKVSSNKRAGNAMLPSVSLSTSTTEDIVVSKSLAETVSFESFSSNRKLSRIGKVFELLMTPPRTCNCFNK